VKPASFDYAAPASLAEAAALLGGSDGMARAIAGGQSLGPMLNLRLVRPRLLVDVAGIRDLTEVEETRDSVTLGACITHADIEDGRAPDPGPLAAVAAGIAYRAVRNRGTIGGSLCHADPAADWVNVLPALGAEAIVFAAGGRRTMPAERFVVGAFETALAPGELLEAVRIPRLSRRARWGYCKFCRKPGEFANALAAVLSDPERGVCRVVIGATGGAPIVLADATPLLEGRFRADAAAKLLEEKGIADPIDRQIRLAALKRAAREAGAS
jgi:carbon-monoxide dehydrogenase medium subunit